MGLIQVPWGCCLQTWAFLCFNLCVFYPVAPSCWVICKPLTFQEFSSVGVGRGAEGGRVVQADCSPCQRIPFSASSGGGAMLAPSGRTSSCPAILCISYLGCQRSQLSPSSGSLRFRLIMSTMNLTEVLSHLTLNLTDFTQIL